MAMTGLGMAVILWVLPTLLLSWRLRQVLPTTVGIPISFRSAWATVCGGRFGLREVSLGTSPAHGGEPALRIGSLGGWVRLTSVGRRRVHFRRLVGREVAIHVRRNSAGEVNLAGLVPRREPDEQVIKPTRSKEVSPPGRAVEAGVEHPPRLEAQIDRLEMNGVLTWQDDMRLEPESPLVVDWTLRGENLRTFAEGPGAWAQVFLQGRGRPETSRLRLEVRAKFRPATAVETLDFEIEGLADGLTLRELECITGPLPAEADSARLEVRLVGKNGQFQVGQSHLVFHFYHVRPRRDLGSREVREFRVTAPVCGTLKAPQMQWKPALAAAALEHAARSPEDFPVLMSILRDVVHP